MRLKTYFLFLLFVLVISSVNAETISRENGNIALRFTSNDFVNTSINTKSIGSYDYAVESSAFKVYFDSDVKSADSSIKIVNSEYSLKFIPLSINYYDDTKFLTEALVSKTSIASVEKSELSYNNVFGEGINIIYKTEPTQIKEYVSIKDLKVFPESKELAESKNGVIGLVFQMDYDNTLNLILDGNKIEEKDFEIECLKEAILTDAKGKVIYKFSKPFALDNKQEKQDLSYVFKKLEGKLTIRINIPYEWLNRAIYPIIIDPTIILVDDVNATILVSPEYQTCYGLECGSNMIIINSGSTNVTFNTSDISVSIENSNFSLLYFYDEVSGDELNASVGYQIILQPEQEFQLDIYSLQKSNGTWKYNVSFNYLNHIYEIDPYYITSNSTSESTTSNTLPQNKTFLNLSLASTKLYAILSSSEVNGIDSASNSFTDLLLDTSQIAVNSEETLTGTTVYNYESKGLLWVNNLSAGNHTLSTRFWSQNTGVTTRIRNSYISAIELPLGTETTQNRANISYTTNLTSCLNKDFNVSSVGDYWVFGSAISDSNGRADIDLRIDNTAYVNATWTPKDTRDYTAFFGQKVLNLTIGSHNISIFANSSTIGSDFIRELNLMAIPLSNSYYWYNESIEENSTTSSSFINKTTLAFNITKSGNYLVVGTGIVGATTSRKSSSAILVVDGVQYCNPIREPLVNTNKYPFMCQVSLNLTEGVHTASIQWKQVQTGTALIRQTSLLVLGQTDRCFPNWVCSNYSSCLPSNSKYCNGVSDLNMCGESYLGNFSEFLNQSCNFCSEYIIEVNTSCYFDSGFYKYNHSYNDLNFYSCCAITNLTEDCHILYTPYNESSTEFCNNYFNNTMNCSAESFTDYGLGSDKVKWFCNLNQPTENNVTCISYVKDFNGGIVQTNPTYQQKSDTFIMQPVEDRAYFQAQKGLVQVYFTKENIVFDDRYYVFGVKCSDGTTITKFEKISLPEYENVSSPTTIWFWLTNNTLGFVIGFLIIFSLLIIISVIASIFRR